MSYFAIFYIVDLDLKDLNFNGFATFPVNDSSTNTGNVILT